MSPGNESLCGLRAGGPRIWDILAPCVRRRIPQGQGLLPGRTQGVTTDIKDIHGMEERNFPTGVYTMSETHGCVGWFGK